MNFGEYQHEATGTAGYPDKGSNLLYPALGLAGEAGETVDKIKKYWRNHGITQGKQLNNEQLHNLLLELGDVLWYVAAISTELGVALEEVAHLNILKLKDRKARGVTKGEGDHR